jgi:hypothetical protein
MDGSNECASLRRFSALPAATRAILLAASVFACHFRQCIQFVSGELCNASVFCRIAAHL